MLPSHIHTLKHYFTMQILSFIFTVSPKVYTFLVLLYILRRCLETSFALQITDSLQKDKEPISRKKSFVNYLLLFRTSSIKCVLHIKTPCYMNMKNHVTSCMLPEYVNLATLPLTVLILCRVRVNSTSVLARQLDRNSELRLYIYVFVYKIMYIVH